MINTGGREAYLVEKTVEVATTLHGSGVLVRIEALKNLETARYSTEAYCQQHISVQPELFLLEQEGPPRVGNVMVWIKLHPPLPPDEASADEAITRAIRWLRLAEMRSQEGAREESEPGDSNLETDSQ
jgi:hypothetical protein